MLTVERNLYKTTAPIRRVSRLHFEDLEKQVYDWICQCPQELNIDVHSMPHGILVRIWNDQFEEERCVHPEDYPNHDDVSARRNPSFAAVVDAVLEILSDLGF
jgi:hypothetical protein